MSSKRLPAFLSSFLFGWADSVEGDDCGDDGDDDVDDGGGDDCDGGDDDGNMMVMMGNRR